MKLLFSLEFSGIAQEFYKIVNPDGPCVKRSKVISVSPNDDNDQMSARFEKPII